MKKFFLIPLMALMTCVSAMAVEVSDLAGLQSALAAGGNITLTADINAGSATLNVTKGVTIKGNGNCVKSTNTFVFTVLTEETVRFEDMVIWSAKTSKGGQGVSIGGVANVEPSKQVFRNNQNVIFENVTINATNRGVNIQYGDGINVQINNCTIQNVQGQAVDSKGNPTAAKYDIELTGTNASNTRGVNFGHLTNSNITITNSTLQGFFYEVNNITGYDPDNGIMEGCKVTVTNCDIKGRAALNVWGYGGEYVFTDCNVVGINNYGGSQEGFACFVFNEQYTCHDNTLTINGGTVVAAVFDAVGGANPNANQYMVDVRYGNNVVVINNSSYTCTKELGEDKGGVIASTSPSADITINGGTYDCPCIVSDTYSSGGETGSLVINGGDFSLLTISPNMDDPDMYSTVELNGGTYTQTESDGTVTEIAIETYFDESNPSNNLIGSSAETINNQDGSQSVVPQGTEAATEKTDPAIKTALVWGEDVENGAMNVVIQPTQTLTIGGGVTANAERFDMGQNAILIVKDGAKLTVGQGGISLANGGSQKPQIIVEQGGTLVLNGLMYGSVPENLVIKASAEKYGQLLINPDVQAHGDNHPNGTFEFITKSRYASASDYTFERFGIPTYIAPTSLTIEPDVRTRIWEYSYSLDAWQDLSTGTKDGNPHFQASDVSKLNKPFIGYNLMAFTATAGTKYTMKGALQGNSNASMDVNMKWTSFANSYTADIDIAKFISSISGDVDASVYLATPAGLGTYTWNAMNEESMPTKKITPMHAFLLNNQGKMSQIVTANYKNTVWNPGTGAAAPARVAAKDNSAKFAIKVANEMGEFDDVVLVENQKFTADYERGHDAEKFMNDGVNIYAQSDLNLDIMAIDNLNDSYLGFSAANAGEYTISFTIADGRSFDLIDLETGAKVAMDKDATYTFHADENTIADYRFKVVERKDVVTEISNTSADKSAKGIYTIMGQYVGEMNLWNALPAGVYVVNGEKRVK